jgi:hypothetical protein
MYHRYLNTGLYIAPNDKIYCKFIGKQDNVIIGASSGTNSDYDDFFRI